MGSNSCEHVEIVPPDPLVTAEAQAHRASLRAVTAVRDVDGRHSLYRRGELYSASPRWSRPATQ